MATNSPFPGILSEGIKTNQLHPTLVRLVHPDLKMATSQGGIGPTNPEILGKSIDRLQTKKI